MLGLRRPRVCSLSLSLFECIVLDRKRKKKTSERGKLLREKESLHPPPIDTKKISANIFLCVFLCAHIYVYMCVCGWRACRLFYCSFVRQ